MYPSRRWIFAAAIAAITSACGGPGANAADPAKVAANRAKADAIMTSAEMVTVDGRRFAVGVSPDRTYSLVEPQERPKKFSGLMLEIASDRVTGCESVFNGGILAQVPGITNLTSLPVKGRLRVEIYCPGDTRNRKAGLPNALPGSDEQAARYSEYPVAGNTYLTFSDQHGFQVNFFAEDGLSWLWYPRNKVAVPERWEVEGRELCFQHPSNTYNPVTGRLGGAKECSPLKINRRLVVADAAGDPFKLSSGAVPGPLDRCQAPKLFTFNRDKIGC